MAGLEFLTKIRITGEESVKKCADYLKDYAGMEVACGKISILNTYLSRISSFQKYDLQMMRVSCPVNVEIYDSNGNLILTVYDGVETSGYQNGIYYYTYYVNDDYVKIVLMPDGKGYSGKIKGVDKGTVSCEVMSINTDGSISASTFKQISVDEKTDIILKSLSDVKNVSYSIIEDNIEINNGTMLENDSSVYTPVTGLNNMMPESIILKSGEMVTMKYQILPLNASNVGIRWSSSDNAVAAVDKDGVVTALASGQAVITATTNDGGFTAATTVNVEVEKRDINSDSITISIADQYYTGKEILADVVMQDGEKLLVEGIDYTVEYSNNIEIGNADVTITGCGQYQGSRTVTFKIIEKPIHMHTFGNWTVNKAAGCVFDGEEQRSCSCGEKEYHIIKAKGHQYGKWETHSEATVFAAEVQNRICTVEGCNHTETQKVGTPLKPTIKVNATKFPLKVKQSTKALKVTGLAKGDSIVSWESSNTKIVKVDQSGKITAQKKTGKATITITLASGLQKQITVTVQKGIVKTAKISGLKSTLTVQKGQKFTLQPVIAPITSLQKVTYSSSNKKVAAVTSKGVITAKKAGTAKITVKSGGKKYVVKVTVPKTKTTKITIAKDTITLKKGKTYTLKTVLTPKNSDEAITFKSSDKKIAAVSSKGKIAAKKKGTAKITVKSGGIALIVKVTVE